MKNHGDLLFKESQKFTQWWLWLFLFGMLTLPIYGMIQQLIFKEPWGSKPMPDIGLMIFALVMAALVYFIYYIKLMTWIHPDSIVVSFLPFFKRKQLLISEIESAKVVTYSIFVGYGLRYSPKYGTIYNIRGNKGLAITMKNGGKYMIGTQHAIQVEEIVKHLLS